MLILTRRIEESIIIKGGITVTVKGIQGGQVRIGIVAPKEISVNREEIQDKIDAERNGNICTIK